MTVRNEVLELRGEWVATDGHRWTQIRRSRHVDGGQGITRPTTSESSAMLGMCPQKAGVGGKSRVGKCEYLGKGGQEVGKRTGFFHIEPGLTRLFPHDL